MLPSQGAQELSAEKGNVVFNEQDLCRSDVHNIARKWRPRCRGMHSVFDFAKQVVDVLASDAQASLLGAVQCTGSSVSFHFRSSFGHDSSKFSSASRSHLPS